MVNGLLFLFPGEDPAALWREFCFKENLPFGFLPVEFCLFKSPPVLKIFFFFEEGCSFPLAWLTHSHPSDAPFSGKSSLSGPPLRGIPVALGAHPLAFTTIIIESLSACHE
jgi:hypothetical protein